MNTNNNNNNNNNNRVVNGNNKRWDPSGEDAQLLQSLFINGTIEQLTPLKVYKLYPQFSQYNYKNFRTTFTRYKVKFGKENNIGLVTPNESISNGNCILPNHIENNNINLISNSIGPVPLNRGTIVTSGFVDRAPTPRTIRFEDEEDEFPSLETNDEDEESVKFGTPSVLACESQYKFGSCCREIVQPYVVYPWYEEVDGGSTWLNRISVNVWLGSVKSTAMVDCHVSEDRLKLVILVQYPGCFELGRVDEGNARIYKTPAGVPMYPSSHVRSVAQKKAIATLPTDKNGTVVFKQVIRLPFKVWKEPISTKVIPGVMYKQYYEGHTKELSVELASKSYKPSMILANDREEKEMENISVSGSTTYFRPIGRSERTFCSTETRTRTNTGISVLGNSTRGSVIENLPRSIAVGKNSIVSRLPTKQDLESTDGCSTSSSSVGSELSGTACTGKGTKSDHSEVKKKSARSTKDTVEKTKKRTSNDATNDEKRKKRNNAEVLHVDCSKDTGAGKSKSGESVHSHRTHKSSTSHKSHKSSGTHRTHHSGACTSTVTHKSSTSRTHPSGSSNKKKSASVSASVGSHVSKTSRHSQVVVLDDVDENVIEIPEEFVSEVINTAISTKSTDRDRASDTRKSKEK